MNSIAKGSLQVAVGTFIKIILTLVIDKYLATKLGVEIFGQYKYGITIVLLISTFCSLGINSSIIRSIAIQKTANNIKQLISISLVLTLITSLVVVVLLSIDKTLLELNSYFLYSSIFFTLNTVYSSVYSGLEKPSLKVWINDVFGFIIYLCFLFLFFTYHNQSQDIALVYLIYNAIVLLINTFFSKRYLIAIDRDFFKSSNFKEYIWYTAPIFGTTVLIMLSTHLDKLVLNYFVSEKDLGIYYAVYGLSNLLPLVLTILLFMYLPRISFFVQNRKENKAIIISSFFSKWTMILASIGFGVLYFYSNELLAFFYSTEFVEGERILKVLGFGQWINVSLGFTGQNLLALGDSKRQLYIRLFTFVVGVVLLFIGVKYFGMIGAAIAIMLSLILSNCLQIATLRIKHDFLGYKKQNMYTFLIILLSGVLIHFFHMLGWTENFHFLISISLDILFFIVILITCKGINEKDLRAIRITEK